MSLPQKLCSSPLQNTHHELHSQPQQLTNGIHKFGAELWAFTRCTTTSAPGVGLKEFDARSPTGNVRSFRVWKSAWVTALWLLPHSALQPTPQLLSRPLSWDITKEAHRE